MDTQENADITNIPLTTSNTEPAIPAREIPEITRVAYLGPSGTFTSVAAQQLADEHTEFIPALDVPNTLRMVRHGEADYGIVPIENSVEGSVNATLDSLMHGELLEIKAETLVPIRFALAVRPGTTLDNITSIATHPHAWAQCRNWIATNIGEVQHIPTNSTAAGAQLLASEEEVAFEAALCPIATCRDLGLTSLSDDVADNEYAVTRFIKVGLPGIQSVPTGADKTTLTVQLPDDEAGALLSMLQHFAVLGINLSRIESRPLGDALGRYSFSIDAEGHIADQRIQSLLLSLKRTCPHIIFHGSYPSATKQEIDLQPGTSNKDFERAHIWLRDILDSSLPTAKTSDFLHDNAGRL